MGKLNRKTRRERLRRENLTTFPFAVCAFSLINDLNIHLIYRTLSNLGGKEFFVIGSSSWFKGATNGVKEYLKITYFKHPEEFLEYIKETDYSLVAFEQSEKAECIYEVEYPKNPIFVFGNESYGIPEPVLLKADKIVEIPTYGVHKVFNVSITSSIAMFDYVKKFQLKQNQQNLRLVK